MADMVEILDDKMDWSRTHEAMELTYEIEKRTKSSIVEHRQNRGSLEI